MSTDEALYQLVRRAVRDVLDERAEAPLPDLETLPAAGRRFSVSTSWLEQRVRGGELGLHGAGRMRRVSPAEVRMLLKRRNERTPPGPGARADQILRSLPGGKSR